MNKEGQTKPWTGILPSMGLQFQPGGLQNNCEALKSFSQGYKYAAGLGKKREVLFCQEKGSFPTQKTKIMVGQVQGNITR